MLLMLINIKTILIPGYQYLFSWEVGKQGINKKVSRKKIELKV